MDVKCPLVLPNLHQNQDLTINFGTAEPRFMRTCSVCLELLHVDTKTTKLQVLRLPQRLPFKLRVVLWVVHHAVCTVPSEILEKQTACIFRVTELVKVAA